MGKGISEYKEAQELSIGNTKRKYGENNIWKGDPDICKTCCCECQDKEEKKCCHDYDLCDCDCHDENDSDFGEHPYRNFRR